MNRLVMPTRIELINVSKVLGCIVSSIVDEELVHQVERDTCEG